MVAVEEGGQPTGRATRDNNISGLVHATVSQQRGNLCIQDCAATEMKGAGTNDGWCFLVAGEGSTIAVPKLD
jgi:hypothetical protein